MTLTRLLNRAIAAPTYRLAGREETETVSGIRQHCVSWPEDPVSVHLEAIK
jgi:hypothetical protein